MVPFRLTNLCLLTSTHVKLWMRIEVSPCHDSMDHLSLEINGHNAIGDFDRAMLLTNCEYPILKNVVVCVEICKEDLLVAGYYTFNLLGPWI